jgi:hypothetical protein
MDRLPGQSAAIADKMQGHTDDLVAKANWGVNEEDSGIDCSWFIKRTMQADGLETQYPSECERGFRGITVCMINARAS